MAEGGWCGLWSYIKRGGARLVWACGVGLVASGWARGTVEWWEGSRKVPWLRRIRERER
jgi:hypothetical protein